MNLSKNIFGLFLIASCISLMAIKAQEQSPLSRRIDILKSYKSNSLSRIALPLGGIGTGTVSLGGRGELRDWEIMNVPAKEYLTTKGKNDAPFFAIYTKTIDGTRKTKALLGPLYDHEYQHAEGTGPAHHGLPRFPKATFETSYPFGVVELSDHTFPVSVKLVGYNPLIPGDADASGMPIAILQYEVSNETDHELEVAISGNIRNFIGRDGQEFEEDWKGTFVPLGAKDNYNTFKKTNDFSGIYMQSNGVDTLHPAWGTMALTIPSGEGQVSYRTSSVDNSWNRAILDFWDDFSNDGVLTKNDESFDNDPMASLAVKKNIKAKETKIFTFYLTWHFPNRQSWGSWSLSPKTRIGNYYTTRYKNAWDVMAKEYHLIKAYTDKSLLFVNSFVNSTYSPQIKEAALFNLSTLRSQTVFRTPDGNMFGWEGTFDKIGSCYGSCTHVWNYEQATPFLFGDLARTMRQVEFGHATDDKGHMAFRVELPLVTKMKYDVAAADGQMGSIMKFYREWQLSGDNKFLEKHWEKVKSALSFAWIKNGWDGNVDGVMEGTQHNTMDVEYFGPNPQMQIWYLGALKASAKMAKAMGDKAFAKKCNTLYETGSKWTDEHLFNGEYYIQLIQPPMTKDNIANGLTAKLGTKNLKDPEYQLGEGCLVDQLVGQYMAHTIGLGYLVKKENVISSLQSIYKYNKKESMFDHFNNMRSYALGDDKALLMASYPYGNRPKIPFPYWSEVMTGFEYTAGVGMLYEGMTDKGKEVIKNIRERYDGSKRNPFDEAECGHHYARAMASWAGIIAESGFLYSGVDKSIRFTDKLGTYFWSNGYSWGICEVKNAKDKKMQQVKFKVISGIVELKRFTVGDKSKLFKRDQLIGQGQSLKFLL
ncbi:MAG: non-lysosomal glucosylceramidase [Carboxylicivirga sp.]|jgi:uncharacterized protein (DUF608 family)|nr:non-lysosomal glucosylceramidase [Carboxylicivirga sp.]